MEKDLLRLLQACIGVVVLLGTAILVFSLFPCMNSEAGAGWAAALFAGLAFGGTIWISRRDNREARRKEKVLAVLTLAELQSALHSVQFALGPLRTLVRSRGSMVPEKEGYLSILVGIGAMQIWRPEQLQPLAGFPGGIAVRLAEAAGNLDFIQEFLSRHKDFDHGFMLSTLEEIFSNEVEQPWTATIEAIELYREHSALSSML